MLDTWNHFAQQMVEASHMKTWAENCTSTLDIRVLDHEPPRARNAELATSWTKSTNELGKQFFFNHGGSNYFRNRRDGAVNIDQRF